MCYLVSQMSYTFKHLEASTLFWPQHIQLILRPFAQTQYNPFEQFLIFIFSILNFIKSRKLSTTQT